MLRIITTSCLPPNFVFCKCLDFLFFYLSLIILCARSLKTIHDVIIEKNAKSPLPLDSNRTCYINFVVSVEGCRETGDAKNVFKKGLQQVFLEATVRAMTGWCALNMLKKTWRLGTR